MYMRLKDNKTKVVTLSYDDGVVQDIRLMEIMDKYGLKGTFNINTGWYESEDAEREKFCGRLKKSEAMDLYIGSGHEVAVHALTHPFLERISEPEIIYEIMEDRKNIAQDYKTTARGMAYPFGTYDDRVLRILKDCGICYSRTTKSTHNFNFPTNWLTLHPTCHHNDERLMELADRFVNEPERFAQSRMFYLWGHSYEFDNNDNWSVIEEFAKFIGNRDDIWYATNIEIYDYVTAYKSLQVSVDKKIIHNPSAIDIWFTEQDKDYKIGPGETIFI